MQLPGTRPVEDPEALWALQMGLLTAVEAVLGPRDASKKICRPQFSDDGPLMRNTPSLDGAFVELSRDGESNWSMVVFEMAHETVHLLNPIIGNANFLEEGVAVAFSLRVQPLYGISVTPSMRSYIHALQLVNALPRDPLVAAKQVRERVGALSLATPQDLVALFPNVDEAIANQLTMAFVRDAG